MAASPDDTSAMQPLLAGDDDEHATVYIVDDDVAVCAALRVLVYSLGWNARSYSSGLRFLDDAPRQHNACLLLDLNMPDIDGEEVLRRLRALGSRLPVLLITGDREGPRLQRVLRSGAQGVLLKPFGDAELSDAVQACLRAA